MFGVKWLASRLFRGFQVRGKVPVPRAIDRPTRGGKRIEWTFKNSMDTYVCFYPSRVFSTSPARLIASGPLQMRFPSILAKRERATRDLNRARKSHS